MNKVFVVYFISFWIMNLACSQNTSTPDRVVGGACDNCKLMFEGIPASFSWETKIAPSDEPGEPILIRGTIYHNDGKTPASGVILYVYHTDHSGIYSPGAAQTAAKRHGHLRGWMKSDGQGRYQFRSIRPAAYPERNAPQHIHATIKEPQATPYWIDEYQFDDDPLLTTKEKAKTQQHGGPGIIHLTKNEKGEWVGQRNIILGLNISGY